MVRVVIVMCLLATSLLHTTSAFGNTISFFLNIRCTFADTAFKEAFKFYDELIASQIVSFYYHSKNAKPVEIIRVNDTIIVEGFDKEKPTRVIIHGFWNSHNSRINKAMKEVYENHYDVNLVIVNYSRISRDVCYKIARSRVPILARKIAYFLDKLLGDDEWQWKNLIVIGHSLGGHTAGVVGRLVKSGRIGSIFALDPAGPGFESKDLNENRLRADDADYVECIHTNGKTLGVMEPICMTDFYPNFGRKQPGCNIFTRDLCSHSRAWKYYAESLVSNFTATECESMNEIKNEIPCNGTEILMGGDDIEAKRNVTGVFFLSTNDEPPYSRQKF